MTDENETARPAPMGPVERPVGRPVPERADDRVLLERAAEAAGIGKDELDIGLWCGQAWNPLENNGDAFWLALRLRISVWRDDDLMRVGTLWQAFGPTDDYEAISRRLIVRAAAMRGKPPNVMVSGAEGVRST